MKKGVVTYSILFGIGNAGMVIYPAVVKGKTFKIWELILTALMLPLVAPLVGLAIWFRHDCVPKKIADTSESERRDQAEP